MNNKLKVLILSTLLAMLEACKDEQPPVDVDDNSKNDFGIFYSVYMPGETYTIDTLYTKFKVLNNGPADLKAGDTLFAGVKVNNVVYNLDLLISSPSALILDKPLAVGQFFEHNAGYLLRTPSLTYFGKDTVDLVLLLYGQDGSNTDLSFPNDPKPGNNTAKLRLTKQNHFIVE